MAINKYATLMYILLLSSSTVLFILITSISGIYSPSKNYLQDVTYWTKRSIERIISSRRPIVSSNFALSTSREAEYFAVNYIHKYTKKILLFEYVWNNVSYYEGGEMFQNCQYSNCILTKNRNLYKWENWDAILWENGLAYDFSIPPIRNLNTRYVLMSREAPSRYGGLRNWKITFNWTMTYRADSEVPFRYGYIYKFQEEQKVVLPKKKSGLAAWMNSNPENSSGRRELRKELEKYIHIDIYGRTGSLECGKHCRALRGQKCDSDCRDMIGNKYKFYFAFENALCKDLVSEKLFTMLQRPIVPVVWSTADLSELAPPYSAINALDFNTAKDLVDYLRYLDKNDTAYFEYFQWKKWYGVIAGVDSFTLSFCHLCASLNQDTKTHWYKNLQDWWVNNQCTNPNSPKIRRFLNVSDDVQMEWPKSGQHFQLL